MSFELVLVFLRPIESLLRDEKVIEIMGNPDASWSYERDGRLCREASISFDADKLRTGLEAIANQLGKRLDEGNPRLQAAPRWKPVGGMAIRKFTSRHYTVDDLIAHGTLTQPIADLLADQIRNGKTLLISRGTGTGKTTILAAVREGAEIDGYRVEGFAPTSRAAQKLGEAGIETSTLQQHLARGQQPDTCEKRLFVLDESSLASTRQLHEFIERLRPNDRALFVGDWRQHEAVEAGRPFAQLQDAGMKTIKLEEIVRQKDLELREVVQQLARGNVREAINNLDQQGRVHEVPGHEERISAIAKEYAKSPENTLVVSPDNRSRMEINERIRAELQRKGRVSGEEHPIRTLVPRQELTGADRTWAAKYEAGDILRYSRGSKETGIGKGHYAQVRSIDAASNRLTVRLQDGTDRTYDPRRQRGVSVYREEMRKFSAGDRIQFTAPANDLKIANRELGAISNIDGSGRLSLKMDSGRSLQIDPYKHPHLDYGYAMTSHTSQGQTASRVLIHVDTELLAKDLLNSRMAYVSVSRGAHDAQLFTNDREKLSTVLGHDISKQTANSPQISTEQTIGSQQDISKAPQQEHCIGLGIGF